MYKQEDRTKELLRELLHRSLERMGIFKSNSQKIDDLIEELSKRYDIYLKYQDNEFRDE